MKISAKKIKQIPLRIAQGDIFQDIEIIEKFITEKSEIKLQKISFPYIICLNQECDLDIDFSFTENNRNSDKCLLHLAIAPAFIFEQFLSGSHWGEIFRNNSPQRRRDTITQKIINNEIPRYHYLKFPDTDMPELIIDFKHFFTINRDELYNQLNKRLCSLDDLFREIINQRFSNYISRIGLPDLK